MILSFLQISTTLLVISVYIEWQRVTLAVCKTTHWCSFIKISVITWCDHLQCLLEELNLRQAATGMWCTRMHKMTELACMLCSGISQMFSSPSRLSHPPSLSFFFQDLSTTTTYNLLAPFFSLRINDRAIMKRAV